MSMPECTNVRATHGAQEQGKDTTQAEEFGQLPKHWPALEDLSVAQLITKEKNPSEPIVPLSGWIPARGPIPSCKQSWTHHLYYQNPCALQAAEDCLSTSKYAENGKTTGEDHRCDFFPSA